LEALERETQSIAGPLILVAHSGGVALVAHWATRTKRQVHSALLATPADLDEPLPAGYPTTDALRAGGWLPIPRAPLPFPAIVAASRNDPLARFERVADMARDWGARLDDVGEVGHLNPASGYGPWPRALAYVDELQSLAVAP
jgi:predicted alpha/beta hydrolase family esterase